jgi:hypothetical protein
MLRRLKGGSSGGRRDGVDDMGALSKAEIFVTDESHGPESRGEPRCLCKTKGDRGGVGMSP